MNPMSQRQAQALKEAGHTDVSRAVSTRMIIGLVAMVVAAIVAANTTDIVRFSPFTAGEFVQRFTPLFLASLFVERAVEVFITSWRDLASMRLKDAQKQAKLAVTT